MAQENNNKNINKGKKRLRSSSVKSNDEIQNQEKKKNTLSGISTNALIASSSEKDAIEKSNLETVIANRTPTNSHVSSSRALFFARGENRNEIDPESGIVMPEEHIQQQEEAWPGPFTTARNLERSRPAARAAREEEIRKKKQEYASSLIWNPVHPPRKHVKTIDKVIPRLSELSRSMVAAYIDRYESLGFIDYEVRKQIVYEVCANRQMTSQVLSLFANPGLKELEIPDCSAIEEEDFVNCLMEFISMDEGLETIKLGWCGRCISEKVIYMLKPILSSLQIISLGGCYRLNDKGLETLIQTARGLRFFHISSNQKLSIHSMVSISRLEHLEELSLQDFPQLSDIDLEPLKELQNLKKIFLIKLDKMTDSFLVSWVKTNRLQNLSTISLAQCSNLSDDSIKILISTCKSICEVDFSDVDKLTDLAFEGLHEYQHPLQSVSLRRCIHLSTNGISGIIQNCQGFLKKLHVTSIPHVGDDILMCLSKHCHSTIQHLDLSFCRGISDNGLGLLTEQCEFLEQLILWGCTQITLRFLLGHGLEKLVIEGHPLVTGLQLRS